MTKLNLASGPTLFDINGLICQEKSILSWLDTFFNGIIEVKEKGKLLQYKIYSRYNI